MGQDDSVVVTVVPGVVPVPVVPLVVVGASVPSSAGGMSNATLPDALLRIVYRAP